MRVADEKQRIAVKSCMFASLIRLLGNFVRRVCIPLESYPCKLLWFASAHPDKPSERRVLLAEELLRYVDVGDRCRARRRARRVVPQRRSATIRPSELTWANSASKRPTHVPRVMKTSRPSRLGILRIRNRTRPLGQHAESCGRRSDGRDGGLAHGVAAPGLACAQLPEC